MCDEKDQQTAPSVRTAPAGLSPLTGLHRALVQDQAQEVTANHKKRNKTCSNNSVQGIEGFDFLVTLKIFTGFSSPDLVATPSTEGINKLLTYQNEPGSIHHPLHHSAFGCFFFFFLILIGDNKLFIYNCNGNGV